jgi:hypothetical protein
MSYDLNTFSNTPAGQYLTRIINERNPGAMKSCSNRIRTFNTNVNEIEDAVADEYMSAHVAANLLRLLRNDAATIELGADVVEGKFISQLLRNVIIGHIKRAIRRVTTMRKIESGNVNLPKVRAKGARIACGKGDSVYNILGHVAGVEFADGSYYRQFPVYTELEDSTTPELLMERSNRRCLRQQKPHMVEKEAKNG